MHAVSHMDIHGETLTVYDKLLCQRKGPLRLSDDQLSVGWRWENVEFSFQLPQKQQSLHMRSTKLAKNTVKCSSIAEMSLSEKHC